jgi:hypothetical protein
MANTRKNKNKGGGKIKRAAKKATYSPPGELERGQVAMQNLQIKNIQRKNTEARVGNSTVDLYAIFL